MSNSSQSDVCPPSPSWRRYWPVALALGFGLAFSLAVFFVLHGRECREVETAFCNTAADRAAAVRNAFESQVSLLESVQAAFNGMQRIDREEFSELLAPLRNHASSIFAVEWAPRISDSRREECEGAARRDGITGFHITELDSQGNAMQAARRDEYYPIFYIGPQPGNPAVFGYDLASEPTRREALCKARDSGKIQASGCITFIQDRTVHNGFLVLLPVYEQGGANANVEERRRNFRGVVLGVFRPDVMIETALAAFPPEGVELFLYDSLVPAGKPPLCFHASRIGGTPSRAADAGVRDASLQLHYRSQLELAGHPWAIECLAIPQFIAARQAWWSWVTLAAGMAFTAIFAAFVMSNCDRRAYAERLVHEKRFYARCLESKVEERTGALKLAQEEIIQRLVAASLWRDQETGMHIRRTGLMSESLAKAAGWSAAEAEIIRQAAPMHDVGKIGIPDAILRKPGKLTPEEFEIIKTHPLIAAEMLADSKTPMLQMAREIALFHHEHWDGQGYPTGLAGQQIPESARIMAIVDVYDALTHDRAYRRAMPAEEAGQIMLTESGTHFDPALLTLFFAILPEIDRLLQENPDDVSNELKLARNFASVLARSNSSEADVLLAAPCSQ